MQRSQNHIYKKNCNIILNSISYNKTLQISLFATGCAGIVAEFVLSSLATYLLGNAIFQWTIVMSFMLFAMGIGSRISRNIKKKLFDSFIITEFALSVFCSSSGIIAFAGFTQFNGVIIYCFSMCIGILIGMEIPLATRINSEFQDLRFNISSIMEMDYFGSLIGGLVFAFFFLPFLGLTYTPIILGTINFIVASYLFFKFKKFIIAKKIIFILFVCVLSFLIILTFLVKPIIRFGEQKKYKDKIVLSRQTKFQKIVITKWKKWYWLYINGDEQFSTYDEERYHEPLVHPAMKLASDCSKILILGGGDGLAAREVLKHPKVKAITLVDIDSIMTDLAKKNPILTRINQGSMNNPKVSIFNYDASKFLLSDSSLYNVIIIDLPDPDSIDLMHLYSKSFYEDIRKRLTKGGIIVTQATSPFFAKKAFLCIWKTIKKAGFTTLPYHNQIPTLGEWGWIIGAKKNDINTKNLKKIAQTINFNDITTKFINNNAMISMIYFGKGVFDSRDAKDIKTNKILDPILLQYYHKGSWGIY